MDENDGSNGAGGEWRRDERPRWKVLDPTRVPKEDLPASEDPEAGATDDVRIYSTVYVADELIVRGSSRGEVLDRIGGLEEVARRAGWTLSPRELEDGRTSTRTPTMRARLSVAPTGLTEVTAQTPDAWDVLRQARRNADGSADGVSLNHVLTTDTYGVNPFKANPFKANPFKANPFKANPFKANAAGVGIDSYGSPGFGGRQPVTYLGPDPVADPHGARPVVAIFDTGLGAHPWFTGDVRVDPTVPPPYGGPIGIDRPQTDPEVHPSLAVPLDGIFDDASGHGTFIAGIIRQECAQARILPVRVADGEGVIIETELIAALARLLEYVERGETVDVLNLSFSFYHETPFYPSTISEIKDHLTTLRDDYDVVIVCSAGNEATDRPTFPAALPATGSRHIAVGALNPANRSVALFSNIGSWVDVYAPGVSLVSTVPVDFDGGVQAGTRDDKIGRRRETLDVDDFRGGFGVWSGTSFAAPLVAGRIAAKIAEGRGRSDAVAEVLQELDGEDHSRTA